MRKRRVSRGARRVLAVAGSFLLIFFAAFFSALEEVPSFDASPSAAAENERPSFQTASASEVDLPKSKETFAERESRSLPGLREDGEHKLPQRVLWCLYFSFFCAGGSLVVFAFSLYSHLRHYHEPKLQRMVCRIGCTMPVFAFASTAACFSVISQLNAHDAARAVFRPSDLSNFSSKEVNAVSALDKPWPLPLWTHEEGASGNGEFRREEDFFQTGGGLSPSTQREPLQSLLKGGLFRKADLTSGFKKEFPAKTKTNGTVRGRVLSEEPSVSTQKANSFPEPFRAPPKEKSSSPYLRFYFQQQQLFFELLKQLTQSTALYSFMSLMIDACGRKSLRVLSFVNSQKQRLSL